MKKIKRNMVYCQCLSLLILLMMTVSVNAQFKPIGGGYITDTLAEVISVSIKNEDSVYVMYRGTAGQTVQRFDDTGWVNVGNLSAVLGNGWGSHILKQGSNNTLFGLSLFFSNFGISVAKYSSGTWDTVGNANFVSVVTTPSMAISSADTAFVSYRSIGSGNKVSVMKYDGTNWVSIGADVFNGQAYYNRLGISSNDSLYIAALASSKVWVKKYNGSTWDTVGGAAAVPTNIKGMDFIVSKKDTLYIAYTDHSTNKITTIKYNGSSWDTVGSANFSTGSASALSLAVNDSTGNIYVTYRDGGPKIYHYNGSSWAAIHSTSISNLNTNIHVVAVDEYGACYFAYSETVNGISRSTVQKFTDSTTWNGSTWTNGNPGERKSAFINSSTAPSGFSCLNLNINSGYSLNTATNSFNIHGDVTNNGNALSGTGTLNFTGDDTSQLYGDTLSHEGTITVASGATLATNGLLRLSSNASNTGRIGNSAGTISGDVMVQRYMPGKRCFRFYGHPFNSSIALSQLTDEIDITGNGGATNGFIATTSNNPSAFYFNVDSADNSTGVNPGWQAFTSATTASWDRYELLRLLVRGAKGQGLSGGSYSPSAATFEGVGAVNQGTQVVTLAKGTNSTFVGCGNPFPSPVEMDKVTRGSNVGANYYAWDATSGTKGAYVTNAWTLAYDLPAYAAFFTTVSANINNTLTFEEADKVSSSNSLFKTTAAEGWVELYIYDSTTKWDRLLINLNSNGMEVEDKLDGKKLYNPGLDFFTLSKDGERLAVDVRPYEDQKSIPLGLTAYNRYSRYVIRTGMFNIPVGTKLMLYDKYLNKQEELKAGSEYWFDVTTDTLSQGNNRFEINMVGKPTHVIEASTRTSQMQLIPNPAYNEVKVSFEKVAGKAEITMMSVTGQIVHKTTVDSGTGSIKIGLSNVPSGIYMIELRTEHAKFTEKLIKE